MRTSWDVHFPKGKRAPKLAVWREKATEEFWSACRTYTDTSLWPTDAKEAQLLLDFFLLDKALYEICYEAANRPAWIRIPLEGATSVLGLEAARDDQN